MLISWYPCDCAIAKERAEETGGPPGVDSRQRLCQGLTRWRIPGLPSPAAVASADSFFKALSSGESLALRTGWPVRRSSAARVSRASALPRPTRRSRAARAAGSKAAMSDPSPVPAVAFVHVPRTAGVIVPAASPGSVRGADACVAAVLGRRLGPLFAVGIEAVRVPLTAVIATWPSPVRLIQDPGTRSACTRGPSPSAGARS